MFKFGRGGGGADRGPGKRPPLTPPMSLHRPGGGRISMGGGASTGRNRVPSGRPPPAAAAPAREETFSLEPGGPLDFAAIIRLTPDLVEEIRRVEALGGVARIKFDSNMNAQSGNVIDVGGKEFNFSWSKEVGDLCDIYEEQRNGEDGNGLLVECGSAWRKLNVQRILDESTKNHVKMRSEEAERQSKARKAIILDPANPSVKSQAKSMVAAAVEGNMRRGWKHKKEHFQKRQKVEANAAKSVMKFGQSSSNNIKGRLSMSPHPSPPEQPGPGTAISPFGMGSSSRGNTHEDVDSLVNLNKAATSSSDKENPKVFSGIKHDESQHKTEVGGRSEDLRSVLISILSENPKGMNMKDLEKVMARTVPNPAKNIESVLKDITTFQAPGKYILKPGVEVVGSKKQASDSRSSPPECNDDFISAIEIYSEKAIDEKIEQSHSSSRLEELNNFEKTDKVQNPSADNQTNNNDNQDGACTSSESGSGSGSDSESSDSGDSGSKSPVGSDGPSSSDSDSDATSSNKEGSDVDVDIISSDDDKDMLLNNAAVAEEIPSTLPMAWDASNSEHDLNGATNSEEVRNTSTPLDSDNFDVVVNQIVEPANRFPAHGNNNAFLDPKKESTKSKSTISEEVLSVSPNQEKHLQNQQMAHGKFCASDVDDRIEKSTLNDKQATQKYGLSPEIHGTKERVSKPKSKRASTSDYTQEKPRSGKRPKIGGSVQVTPFRKDKDAMFLDNLQDAASLESKKEGNNKSTKISTQENKHETTVVSEDLRRPLQSPSSWSCPVLDVANSGKSNANLNRGKLFDKDKSSRSNENFVEAGKHAEYTENRGMQNKIGIQKDKKQKKYENRNTSKYFPNNVNETIADKLSNLHESHRRKNGDFVSKGNGQPSVKYKSDVAHSPLAVGKISVLRREPSELELGEFRDSTDGDDFNGVKIQFERKGSFKTENKVVDAENFVLDISKERIAICAPQEMEKEIPRIRNTKGNRDGNSRITSTDKFTVSAQPVNSQPRATYQNTQFSRTDCANADMFPFLDKPVETAARNETRLRPEMNLENHTGIHEASTRVPPHDNRSDGQFTYGASRESRSTKLTPLGDFAKRSGNVVSLVSDTNESKRRDSSDEDTSFYVKYDKEKPELKGLIKDFLQYKDYVQEYQEKYEVYYSLNKNLQKIRNDFLKISHDLELAIGKDLEAYTIIVERLRALYHQHGENNKHMKKVFILLHEELKNLKQRIKDFADSYKNE